MAIRPAGAGLGIDITSFLGGGPNFGEMGQQGILEGAKNQAASFGLSAEVANAGMGALGQIAEAEHQARGIKAGGDAAAHSSMMGGISSLAGSIAGGLGSMNFGASGGGGYGQLPNNPMDDIRRAGITGPIYDFQT